MWYETTRMFWNWLSDRRQRSVDPKEILSSTLIENPQVSQDESTISTLYDNFGDSTYDSDNEMEVEGVGGQANEENTYWPYS